MVNEGIVEEGCYGKSKFYEMLGEEFIGVGLEYGEEGEGDGEVYYNDYGMEVEGGGEGVVKVVG